MNRITITELCEMARRLEDEAAEIERVRGDGDADADAVYAAASMLRDAAARLPARTPGDVHALLSIIRDRSDGQAVEVEDGNKWLDVIHAGTRSILAYQASQPAQ